MFDSDWLAVGALFFLVSGLTFAVIYWVQSRRREAVEKRLDAARDDDSLSDVNRPLVLGDLTAPLAQAPMSEAERQALQKELREAGFYRPTALMEYTAVRMALVIFPLLAAGAVALLVDNQWVPHVLIGGLCVAALGFSIPRVYLSYVARRRSQQIERGLPVAVDLLTLGLTGGQNIFAALQRVSRELRHSYPVLAEELQIVHFQATMGNLEHALYQFANRTSVQEVRNLALVLTQSERLGTDVGTALLEFSANFRSTLRQRAEATANRTSFWMLFPSILCLWFPATLMLFGPVLHEFARSQDGIREVFQKNREQLDNIRKNSPQATPPPKSGNSENGVSVF
jgi:tight adherence protein C